MKQPLKATVAILGTIAAGVLGALVAVFLICAAMLFPF